MKRWFNVITYIFMTTAAIVTTMAIKFNWIVFYFLSRVTFGNFHRVHFIQPSNREQTKKWWQMHPKIDRYLNRSSENSKKNKKNKCGPFDRWLHLPGKRTCWDKCTALPEIDASDECRQSVIHAVRKYSTTQICVFFSHTHRHTRNSQKL